MVLTSIITVNYNQPKVTLEFLNSVAINCKDDNIELILIDNGSEENYEIKFKTAYPAIKYYRSEKNLGFAGGNNLGIKMAKGEFLLFLNNDTELAKNTIKTLLQEFQDNPNIGLLSPLIMYFEDKNKIQYAGFSNMNYLTARNKRIGNYETETSRYEGISKKTGFSHGAAMMCRAIDLKEVGLMDESYFLYYEELDWCEKFKKAGKEIWFTGKTKIYHKESLSVGKDSSVKIYFMHRNRMLFIRKNTNAINTVLFGIYYIGFACPKNIVKYYLKGRKDLIPWVIKAIVWNLNNKKNSTILGYKIVAS